MHKNYPFAFTTKKCHYITRTEVEKAITPLLAIDNYQTLVEDIQKNEPDWKRGTIQHMIVEPEKDWIQPDHTTFLEIARANQKVSALCELQALLNELGRNGKLPLGPLLITVN